ncbi:hypothetical protein CDL26_14115 [Mediterraneibacter gnavus]|uniref:Helix-turn-helix conjugative transposon-like domain-containing protein n=1 Tax=Mediterraneibacter gnavus TaxID=33038 RepID=A0A2N5P6G9_MEDGN|nr:helix-turn-helix domain-containing protein [Mediterraneibacter gnavus]PLT70728.1 hypothetical protein CDL26_14115 [Mediterraneibacter gnavus]
MNKMKKLIPYETIQEAVNGNPFSINQVLRHYDGYINFLCRRKTVMECGKEKYQLDEMMKVQLQTYLIESILRFKIVL